MNCIGVAPGLTLFMEFFEFLSDRNINVTTMEVLSLTGTSNATLLFTHVFALSLVPQSS